MVEFCSCDNAVKLKQVDFSHTFFCTCLGFMKENTE